MSQKQENTQTTENIQNLLPVKPNEINTIPHIVESVVSLLALYGKQISPYTLMGGRATDFTPAEALRSARKLGFSGNILRRYTIESISPLTLPCILLLNNKESCILFHKTDKECTILLPAYEETQTTVNIEELQNQYTGYALFLNKQGKEDNRTASIKLLNEKKWFWDVIWHYFPIYKHVLVASILINIIALASSLFSMNVYDRVVPNHAIATLWALAIGLIVAYGIDFVLKNLRSYFVDLAGRNADVILSSKLVGKILTMKYSAKPESTGVLANNIREFESLREFFSSSTLLTFIDIPFVLLFLALVWYIGSSLIVIPLIAIPIMIIIGIVLQFYSAKHVEQGFKQNMQKNALLVEIINGLETIKCCSAEQSMQNTWDNVVGASALAGNSSRTVNGLITSITGTFIQIVSLAVIVWGVYLISAGHLTMGALIACNILVGRAMAPLMQVSAMLTRVQQSRMTLKVLDTLMQSPSENPNDTITIDTENLDPILHFENVNFAYPNSGQPVLSNLNFTIKPGEKVGIIGRMGSGKSTIAKLIAGLYCPTEGAVTFNNLDLRQVDMQDLRAHIGFLPQDVVLFYGSIRDNIALNDKVATDRLVLRAAQLAGVVDFAKKNPAGLAAQVGERGMNFSGGQRQAIALARAMLHQPEILILDEPSSNMDTQSEEELKKRIQAIIGESTLIIITHRMSMLGIVDRLIVIDNGTIIADGKKSDVFKALQGKNHV